MSHTSPTIRRACLLFALYSASLCICAASLCAACVFAAEEQIDPVGRPEKFRQGALTGYAVYFEKGAWNLRMTSKEKGKKKKRAVFTGTITVDKGRITDGAFQGLEVPKNAKDLPKSDWIRMHRDQKGFDFHFITLGKTDGLSFQTTKTSETITFKLLTSGDDETRTIMIGKRGQKPDKDPFDLPAHPKEISDDGKSKR